MMFLDTSAEMIVTDMLRKTGACLLDDLVLFLPHLSWTTIFMTVDQMARDGRVVLNQVDYTYQVLLAPPRRRMPPVIVGFSNHAARSVHS